MNEHVITSGLEADRYLKAAHLVNRFREEIREALEDVSRDTIDDHGELFDDDISLDWAEFGVDSRTLTTMRIESDMNREHEEFGSLKLNIGFEWVEAGQQNGDTSGDDSMCYVYYKIQRGSEPTYETVKQRTQESEDWTAIQFGEDMWPYASKEAPGIAYIPVKSGADVTAGLETLRHHFSAVYAPLFRD
jgi:hypothetical protein